MAFDLLLLGANITTGAIVGYLTNSLAIRMLFREFPIIGGGEVIKNRADLEEAMSELVEEQLITPDTLLEEFDKPAFKASFEQLIRQIISHHLKERVLKLDRPDELGGYHETLNNLKRYLIQQREPLLDAGLDALFDHLQVLDLLSPEQLKQILSTLWQLLLDTLETHHEALAQAINQSLADLSLTDLIDKESLSPLLLRIFAQIDPQRLETQLFNLLDRLQAHLALPELLNKLEQQLRQRSLAEILGELSDSEPSRKLLMRLLSFLNTPHGEKLLSDLLQHGIQVLKKLDLPIAVLLNQTLERQLLTLMHHYLPPLLERLENWSEVNRQELEALVQEAIQEHLRSESLMKHMTASLFSDQIASRYHIIEKVLEEIKAIVSQSMPDLVQMVNRFVANTTVGQGVTYLEKHLLDYQALTRTLLRVIRTYLPRLDLSVLDPILVRPLNSFSILNNLHLAPLWQAHVYPYIQVQLRLRLLPQSAPLLSRLTLKIWSQLADKPLNSFLPDSEVENLVQQWLPYLEQSPVQNFLLTPLEKAMPDLLAHRSLNSMLSERVRLTLWRNLGSLYEQRLDSFLGAFQREKMEDLYQQVINLFFSLSEYSQIAKQIREVLVGFLIELIRDNRLFKGRIYQVVKESFYRFSDEEMQAEMEGFMGAELQPITLLGAVLGAGIGALLSLADLIPGAELLTKSYAALLVFPLVYAVTGIFTNWLAIRMLFRPRYPKRWPFSKKQLPFTPGVFIKNKAALAASMAKFINQKLLSKQNMVGILERYHERWKTVIKGVISQNNYAALDQRIRNSTRDNYDELTPLLLDLAFQNIYRYRQDIAKALVEEVHELSFAPEDLSDFQHEILAGIRSTEPQVRRYLNQRIEDGLHSHYPIADLLPPAQLDWVQQHIQGLLLRLQQQATEYSQQPEPLLEQISRFSADWDRFLELQLEELTPGQSLPKAEVVAFLLDWVQSEALQTELNQLLQRYLETLFDSGQTLGELWNGRVLELMQQESNSLVDIMAGYLLEMARHNKDRIAKAVSTDVQKQGLMEVMLVNFGGVRKDVYRVVDVVIERKLAGYLSSKSEGLKDWLQMMLATEAPQLALQDLGLEASHFEIEALQEILRETVLKNPQTAQLLTDLADGVVDEFLQQFDLKALLQSLKLYSLTDILARFAPELELVREHLCLQLQTEEAPLHQDIWHFAESLLTPLLLEPSLKVLLQDLPVYEFKQRLRKLLTHLYHSPAFEILMPGMSTQILEPLAAGDISRFLDPQILEKDTLRTIERLSLSQTPQSQAFQTRIRESLKALTIGFIDLLNLHIEQDTKQDLENMAVDSLIDGLRINNRELLEPIDFEEIVHTQVMRMNPQRIESLFDFAQPIFRALIWYGALGGVIGIVAGLLAAFS